MLKAQRESMPSRTTIAAVIHPEVWICAVDGEPCMIRIPTMGVSIGARDADITMLKESESSPSTLIAAVEAELNKRIDVEELLKMPMIDLDPQSKAYGHLAGMKDARLIVLNLLRSPPTEEVA